MNKKSKLSIVIVIFVFVIIAAIQYIMIQDLEKIIADNEDSRRAYQELNDIEVQNLMNALHEMEKENTSNKELISKISSERDSLIDEVNALVTMDSSDEWKLEEMGISDIAAIEHDLYEKPELIPYDGVLGGTMFFYKVNVINHKWAYARFEDGHINGYGLFEFEIGQNEKITWKLIRAELY